MVHHEGYGDGQLNHSFPPFFSVMQDFFKLRQQVVNNNIVKDCCILIFMKTWLHLSKAVSRIGIHKSSSGCNQMVMLARSRGTCMTPAKLTDHINDEDLKIDLAKSAVKNSPSMLNVPPGGKPIRHSLVLHKARLLGQHTWADQTTCPY